MNPGIFLIQNNEELVEMNEQQYDSERLLQSWLAKYPALLVGNQIDSKEPRRWLLIEQECAVPSEVGGAGRWAIDHLFLDQDAIPTIVEVKRSTDTRIRREVVGQMLDYAANATVHWPVAHMRERFAANCEAAGVDPEEKLREFLEEELEPEDFWQNAERNLRDRNIRLLFVADFIPAELQRIVEFLNDQMDKTEVLAIEIKQFVGAQGLRSLVPRVIGQTSEGQQKKASGTRATKGWNEEKLLSAVEEKRGVAEANVVRRLLEWAKQNVTRVSYGHGVQDGSFSALVDYGAEHAFIPFIFYTYGKVEVMFKRMKVRHEPFTNDDKRRELLRRLNQIPGLHLPEDGIHRRPSIALTSLVNPDAFAKFIQVIEWTIKEVKSTQDEAMENG